MLYLLYLTCDQEGAKQKRARGLIRLLFVILVTETQRRAAVFAGSTSTSDVTWTGSGSMSPVVTMLTTVPGPALT